jgi:hypothetical protein
VQEALTAAEALRRLSPSFPSVAPAAVLCLDSAITKVFPEQNSEDSEDEDEYFRELANQLPDPEPEDPALRLQREQLLKRIIEFAKAGGTVVLAGQFSSNFSFQDAPLFFSDFWALAWVLGSYHRTTFARNESFGTLALPLQNVPLRYNAKALHLQNVDSTHALYFPEESARLQSRVFPPTPVENHHETPVAFSPVGEGYLGYVGDVNHEEETTTIIVSMCGLAGGARRKTLETKNMEQACHWYGCESKVPIGNLQRCAACRKVLYCNFKCQKRCVLPSVEFD